MTNLQLVRKVDLWAQDNNDQELEERLNQIYQSAKDNSYGWESVEESSPDLFSDAVKVAKANLYRIEEENL